MQRWMVFASVVAVACDGGGGKVTCDSGDYECYLDHLVVSENGKPLELTKVASIPMSGGGNPIPDSGSVWAVGTNSVIRRWNGAWQSLNGVIESGHSLTAVHGASESDVWIGGDSGTLLRWNGTALTPVTIASTHSVTDIYAFDANNAYLTTFDGASGHYCTWNGTQIGCIPGTLPILRSVWRTNTATSIWVTGGDVAGPGYLQNMGDSTPALANATPGFGVWGHDQDIWVAGAQVQRWIDRNPSDVTPAHQNSFRAITGVVTGGAISHVFVSEDDVGVHHWVNGTWTKHTLPFRVFGLWAHNATDVWAVGNGGSTAHWDGASWMMYTSNTDETLQAVWSSGPSAPAGGGGGGGVAPSFTGPLGGPLTFSAAMPENTITIPWADPAGCRPSFCFSACSPSGRCFAPARCTKLVPDGLLSGSTTLGVKYAAAPAGAAETFDLWITLVSTPDWSQPAQNGMIVDDALVGGGAKITQIVEPTETPSGGTCGITASECESSDACCNGLTRKPGVDADRCLCEASAGQACYQPFGDWAVGSCCMNTGGGMSAEGTVQACGDGYCAGSDAGCQIGETCQFFGGEYSCFAVCMYAGAEPGSGYPCCAGLVTTADDPRCHYPAGHLCNSGTECARVPPNSPPLWSMCVPQSDGTARCDATGARL